MIIKASSTISHQPSFREKGFSATALPLLESSQLLTPDYSTLIPPMERRRMSEGLKMGIACTIDCLEQAGITQPAAVIVGTSMGCPVHTKNFLDKIIEANGSLLSPTAFTFSLHNTIAGQISLFLKNHGHNFTHTHSSLSFEQALIDALLCLQEGRPEVLVGGVDELETTLYNIRARLKEEDLQLTSGASFFVLSSEMTEAEHTALVDVESYSQCGNVQEQISRFLQHNNIAPEAIDLVLYSCSTSFLVPDLVPLFGDEKLKDFRPLCGTWFTNSAFAMAYAIDVMAGSGFAPCGKVNRVLICNNLIPENLGLILLENRKST